MDLKDGFHQINVHPDYRKYFLFAMPDGQYEYNRLPFGCSESPAEFQKRLVHILRPLVYQEKLIVYIDDILIPSESVEENLQTLSKVLIILKKYRFEVNYRKCQFLKTKIEYLGYILSPNAIEISSHHTDAIRNFPRPKSVLEVQRFLGLTGYFRKFIQDYSRKAKPLHHLLKKSVDFNDQCVYAFELLKNELCSRPILSIYNPSAEIQLYTDASSQGLGAILLQKMIGVASSFRSHTLVE